MICYCAMIDYAAEMAAPKTAQDADCVACITPPPMSEAAKALAAIINEFGTRAGADHALGALHHQYEIAAGSSLS